MGLSMDREAIVWCLCLFSFLVHFMGRCFVWTLYVNAAILNKIPQDFKEFNAVNLFHFHLQDKCPTRHENFFTVHPINVQLVYFLIYCHDQQVKNAVVVDIVVLWVTGRTNRQRRDRTATNLVHIVNRPLWCSFSCYLSDSSTITKN